jgi:CheY-like chemotaxis protein
MTNVQLSEDEVTEFKIEAEELLDQAEQSLLDLDKGGSFQKGYDAIFRAFHSVKGAAGMLNWENLQHHMHQLETHFQNCKGEDTLSKQRVTYFLNGIDGCRKILDGAEITFTYQLPENSVQASTYETDENEEQQEMPIDEVTIIAAETIAISEPNTNLGDVDTETTTELTEADHAQPSTQNLSLVGKTDKTEPENEPLVFVIDDEPDIVDILTDMLEGSGYKIKGFTQALEAISAIDKLKPQAIFTDMNMPELTGFEVLKKVHAIDPDLPVVFVSAHLSKQLLIDALAFGVFGAIEKPFDESQILNICRIATKRYQLWCLLNRSINFVLYQYSGLEEYLTSKGLHEVKDLMVKEMQILLDVRRQLREEKSA